VRVGTEEVYAAYAELDKQVSRGTRGRAIPSVTSPAVAAKSDEAMATSSDRLERKTELSGDRSAGQDW